jgi:hypothetical protein
MPHISKRTKAIRAKVEPNKPYPLADALALVKETATAKFDESVDVAVVLGIDAKKSDQNVRGSVVLPAGTGKTVRVAVFAQGAKAEEAKAAGADEVGFDDLAAKVGVPNGDAFKDAVRNRLKQRVAVDQQSAREAVARAADMAQEVVLRRAEREARRVVEHKRNLEVQARRCVQRVGARVARAQPNAESPRRAVDRECEIVL